MTRRIDLREYRESEPHRLSATERDTLRAALPSLTVQPATGQEGEYCLRPGSTVGAVEIGELSVLIKPKIGIPQLLSLACYAISKFKPRPEAFDFTREDALPDVLALALASAAGRAFAQGLLHGYRTEEEALHTVRGRIRFDEQIRRRFRLLLPVEVRYDEFTDDILANRLVRAAAARLGGMRLRSLARTGLGRVHGDAGQRLAGGVSAERGAGAPLRPAERALPRGCRAVAARAAAQRVRVPPRACAGIRVSDGH